MDYNKAYDEWDGMTPKERMDWCKSIGEECDNEMASMEAYELSENYYCFWTTIKEILMED